MYRILLVIALAVFLRVPCLAGNTVDDYRYWNIDTISLKNAVSFYPFELYQRELKFGYERYTSLFDRISVEIQASQSLKPIMNIDALNGKTPANACSLEGNIKYHFTKLVDIHKPVVIPYIGLAGYWEEKKYRNLTEGWVPYNGNGITMYSYDDSLTLVTVTNRSGLGIRLGALATFGNISGVNRFLLNVSIGIIYAPETIWGYNDLFAENRTKYYWEYYGTEETILLNGSIILSLRI